VAISVVGLVINALTASIAFHLIHLLAPGIDTLLAANGSAIAGTIVVMLFNFFGYRLLVFRTPA
jgi:hypothetical protein